MDNNYFNNQPNQNNAPEGNSAGQSTGGFATPNPGQYQFDPQPQPNPYTTYTAPKSDNYGSSAQIMGILAIVLSIVCCSVVGIVLGLMAMSRAKRSVVDMGFETSEAKTGNICGIIGLVIGIVGTLASLAFIALYIIGVMSILAEGGTLAALPLFALL